MPRRRGSTNSAGRRTTIEDGRCNGSKKIVAPPRSTSKIVIASPPIVQPVNEIPTEATQSSDLGYLHKKFKKVAATFSTTPEPDVVVPVKETVAVVVAAAAAAIVESKKEDDGSCKSTKSGRYVCHYCQHVCAKPSVLEKHIRAHTNERPYPCIPCGFAFKTKSNLYKHCKSRTHVLKLEETGAQGTTPSAIIDPVEGGSDDTSDDNVMLDDSDDGEALVPAEIVPVSSSSPAEEKFKTPYKPKFHNFKNSEDNLEITSQTSDVTEGSNRPSPGFLHERISQIISKNQAIVETLDPIWPRRYVRQSSRGDNKEIAKHAPNSSSPIKQKLASSGRERSCSLSLMTHESITTAPLVIPCTTRVLQESCDESQRKRCYSEGPAVAADNQIRHSVRNLLQQPAKSQRTLDVFNPQNPEGSIIKDILLKSRGLLPVVDGNIEIDPPTKMSSSSSSSSFTVNALLNPSRAKSAEISVEVTTDDQVEGLEHPSKKLKVSSPEIRPSSYLREDRMRTSLPLFGGEVEIHDGPQRTVMRIDPVGYAESNRTSNGQPEATATTITTTQAVIVTKAYLNSGGGIVRIQPQESRILPVIKTVPSAAGLEIINNRSVIHSSSSVPYIPGIPGPYSSSGWLPASSSVTSVTLTQTTASVVSSNSSSSSSSSSSRPVPSITVHPPSQPLAPPTHAEERTDSGFGDEDPPTSSKFLRPNSLSLQPGTFNLKKTNMAGLDHCGQPNMLCVSGSGMTLISPETPRPRKLFRQLYLNGHAYTYLGLKCSTRVYFCCLSRAQPMYVPHHPKLSMYSQWKTRAPVSAPPGLEASSPIQTMALYDSRQRSSTSSIAQANDHGRMILTHSSYWTNRDRPTTAHFQLAPLVEETSSSNNVASNFRREMINRCSEPTTTEVVAQPKRVRIFAGGYKSTEDYTYVRGRGRGRYVCEECGIRCKKPSMLKKHIRTHTDLRPYTCRQCNFSFKTKGNLTKHMKSKAHHKKCTELGIVPVPTTVDEANIDEDSLARQETLKKMKLASGCEGDSDLDDEDDEDDDEEEDEEMDEEEDEVEEESQIQLTLPVSQLAQFEDAAAAAAAAVVVVVSDAGAIRREEQEVARSLLDLGVIAPAGCKPTTYPYASHLNPPDDQPTHVDQFKEETPPSSLLKSHQQPIDLSTTNAIVTASSALLASIYSPIVNETAARRGTSRSADDHSVIQPASSGMLQAYLTEKALKEGLMKRHQVKLMTPSSAAVAAATATVVVENPVVTFFPNPSRSRSEFVVPLSSTSSAIPTSATAFKLTDDGKTACSICNKVFTKPSQLRLHINIHYFERPFRCEACAVSFRTKGHLQKHKRSVTHFNKVNMNLTFGTPSTENPRPFKCSDCMIAFRIHGHLAKHLRSKMHIMKLECLGKLPFGTYAEMERSGINLNEIDTTDCHNSLESLQSLAHRLYKQDPSKIQQWQQEAHVGVDASLRERTISESSEEFSDVADECDELDDDGEDSEGLPDGAGVDQIPPRKSTPPIRTETNHTSRTVVSPPLEKNVPAMFCSVCGESCSSMEAFQLHVMEKHPPPMSPPPPPPTTTTTSVTSLPPATESPAKLAPLNPDIGRIVNLAVVDSRRSPSRVTEVTKSVWNRGPGDIQYVQPRGGFHHPSKGATAAHSSADTWPLRPPMLNGDLMNINPLSAIPPQWHQDPAAMAWIASRHMMLPMASHPHNYSGAQTTNGTMQPRLYSPTSSSSSNHEQFACELCGKSFTAKETLRQHMMAHAQLRPFVCEFCDAGFTTQKQLESHLVLHRPRTS